MISSLKILTFFTLFFLLSAGTSSSQINSKARSIIWHSNKLFENQNQDGLNKEKRYYFSFNDADYPDYSSLLPFYNEVIKIENPNLEIELINQKFVSLSQNELENIKGIENLKNNISIIQKVYYQKKSPFLQYSFIPLIKNPLNNSIEKLINFEIKFINKKTGIKEKKLITRSYAPNSALSQGKWIKIKIKNNGVYRLTFADLKDLGISNPQNVRIFGFGPGMLPEKNSIENKDDLNEIKIQIDKENVYFYAYGANAWNYDENRKMFVHQEHLYSDFNYYFITSEYDSGVDNKINTGPLYDQISTKTISYFYDFQYHESKDTNFVHSGKKWYGEMFDTETSYDFKFKFPNLLQNSEVKLRTSLISRSSVTCSFNLRSGSLMKTVSLSPISYEYDQQKASEIDSTYTFMNYKSTDEISLNITYNKSTSISQGFLDFIEINTLRNLIMQGNSMEFTIKEDFQNKEICEFVISNATQNLVVWDITNPINIQIMPTRINGNTLNFKEQIDSSIHRYIVFDPNNGFNYPIIDNEMLNIENQNLHGLSGIDYIIISYPSFIEKAKELAQYHRDKDFLKVEVFTPQQVYNEFSSGMPDISAIRNFMRMLYDRAGTDESKMPKYLLLVGDGSFDNKSSKKNNPNYILTYQSENSLHPAYSFVSDDFFALLDYNEGGAEGLLDIGVGRLPVQSIDQLNGILKKIYSYHEKISLGDWRNIICFLGDDEDHNLHMEQADSLASKVNRMYPNLNTDKILFDTYKQITTSVGASYPEVNEAFNNRVQKGALIINYTGHGREIGLAHENILTLFDIKSWENYKNLPLFMTATCEFSRFDETLLTSAGEEILLNPNGGGIALFSTTRLVFADANFSLNWSFYDFVFGKDKSGATYRLGDIMRLTKNNAGSGPNKRNFILLGDPALTLAYPQYQINTTKLNSIPVETSVDTLKAFKKISIEGLVQDNNGVKLTTFDGTIYPTIYDKKSKIVTLDNDHQGIVSTFEVQNNIIYKGKATVLKGDFKFSFIVPKDISYKVGFGKISYYAENKELDASGYFNKILIGSAQNQIEIDNKGPEIKLFMNDTNFVNGSPTTSNPVFLAMVKDFNGINTSSSGIGHDITAILDNQDNTVINLNDSYSSDKDSYQSGIVEYPLRNLKKGAHKLKFKIWDIYNNSSEEEMEFTVDDSDNFNLSNIYNYPNPFTTKSGFYFEHNKPFNNLEILIQIYTVSGKLIKTIQEFIYSEGYRCGPIFWDGYDDFGNKIGKGVYFYRLKISTEKGIKVEKISKLLKL